MQALSGLPTCKCALPLRIWELMSKYRDSIRVEMSSACCTVAIPLSVDSLCGSVQASEDETGERLIDHATDACGGGLQCL